MKRGSLILFLALSVLFMGAIGCQQKTEAPPAAKQEAQPVAAKQETPPAPAQEGQQAAPATQPAPAPAEAQKAPAAGEPGLEVKSHIKQGLSYVSVAKNAKSPGIFNENIGNAINEFSNAINKDPNYAEAYSNRGVAYMLQKKYNKALDDLKKAKELKPDSSSIRYNLASCYSLMGSVDYGLDELDAALEKGFNSYDLLRKDPDIANLRKHKEYKGILEKHKVFIVQ